jgi:hypothetical protein
MTDMRAKVIQGLESCVPGPTTWCQMREKGQCGYDGAYCVSQLHKDAAELLRAQEPHVLSLEEIDDIVTKSNKEHERIFWAEVKSRTRYSFGVFQLDLATNDDYEALLLGCAWPAWYRRSSYGFRWRCWSSRPTDKQRKGTPWE